MSIDRGTRLGPYEVIGFLASGGMGDVYRARDPRLRRDVAIKTLKAHLASTPELVERFQIEARAVAALSDPNVMSVFDFGREGDTAFIVYELLEGETLRALITRERLSWRRAAEIAADVASGLAAAHAKGITHGDLKPENIFLTAEGRVKIVDFGLAQLAREANEDENEVDTEPVVTLGSVGGTLIYMAPEMIAGMPPSAASDIFALGCVVYEMIDGQPLFARNSQLETTAAIVECDPPSFDATAKLPAEIEAIVQRCVAKNPAQRFRSAHDLALILRALASSSTSRMRVAALPSARRVSRATIGLIAAAILIAITVAAFWITNRKATPAANSIAVLPFENATGDADAEYLADGITENLINALSQIPSLSVKARASVFRLKGKHVPLETAAHDLGADVVVTGRLLRRANGISVSAELVNGREGRQIWGAKYERRADQLSELQATISRDIADELRLRLTDPVRAQISRRIPDDSDAYELYLRGRFYWNKRGEENFMKAIDYFNRAIAREPTFALGYSGLADCYLLLNGYGLRPPDEVVPKAKAAAVKALQLDPNLAEAHATLAAINANNEFNWTRAEEEYRRAVALNPSYATARQWYGGMLCGVGRFDEGMVQLDRALALDPLSPIIAIQIGLGYFFGRRYDDAIKTFQHIVALDPNYATAYEYLALTYEAKQMYPESVANALRSRKLEGDTDAHIAELQRAFDRGVFAAYKRQVIADLLASHEFVSPPDLAEQYCAIGEKDKAIAALQRGLKIHSPGMIWMKMHPAYDPIRSDPRFQECLRRINLQ
jgi:serine/threonine-protein kinase